MPRDLAGEELDRILDDLYKKNNFRLIPDVEGDAFLVRRTEGDFMSLPSNWVTP